MLQDEARKVGARARGRRLVARVGLAEDIRQAALDCGFDDCGIVSIDALEGYRDRLEERMAKVPESRAFYGGMFPPVKERYPWAKAAIVLTWDYGKFRFPQSLQGRYGKSFFLTPEAADNNEFDQLAFMRRVRAMGIHITGGDRFPLRFAAAKAGLGIVRKNNFFYTEKGSNAVLFGCLADCDCTLVRECTLTPCSEKCHECQKACRSGALCGPYTMNPIRCIGFWTTFGKGAVPPFLTEGMYQEWILGCDNCQDACPHNRRHDWSEGEPFSDVDAIAPKLVPEAVLQDSDEFLQKEVIAKSANHLGWGDTDVLRRNAERALRNRAARAD